MSQIVQTRTNIKNRTRKALQRGFSNVQIAIGILVTVILLLGALSGYQYIQQSKISNEIAMLTDLRTATIRYGQVTGQFDATAGKNADIANLIALNFFNGAGLNITGGKVYNQWGGEVTVATGTASVTGDSLEFSFANVPSSACKEITTKIDNIVSKVVAGTQTTKANAGATDIAKVITGCGSAGPVTIAYTISK